MILSRKNIGKIIGPLAFLIVRFFFYPDELSDQANATLACTLWIAIWWITEAVSLSVTALLPIVLFPLLGVVSIAETTASYGHKYIFLFLGGFILAVAIEKWHLHKRVALNIINLVGSNPRKIILGFMIATGFLSMWISNTSTAVMMLPVALAVVNQYKESEKDHIKSLAFGKSLMLAIAYSASIGGMATLIGTPPNLVLAGIVEKHFQVEITFFQWFLMAFPLSVILLIFCWFYLTIVAYKVKKSSADESGKSEIKSQIKGLGKLSFEEKWVLVVFLIAAFSWITRSFFLEKLLPGLDDTIIAIFSALLLFLLPSKQKNKAILSWADAQNIPWGILILFGGGMALATAFEVSGLALWIGSKLTYLEGYSVLFILLIIIAVTNFLTEITSNMATTAMLLPILIVISELLNINPYLFLVGATLAASCAFMLPAATPPNAIVFASKIVKIEDMVKVGFTLNVISIIFFTLFIYFILPHIWSLV